MRSSSAASLLALGGVAGIAAGPISLALGGPGALAWSWLGTAIGLVLIRAELLGARGSNWTSRPMLARACGAAGLLVALTLGGLWTSFQFAETTREAWGFSNPILVGGLLIAAGAFTIKRRFAEAVLTRIGPPAVVLLALVWLGALVVHGGGFDALRWMLALVAGGADAPEGFAAGTVIGAVQVGAIHAVVVTHTGLGTARALMTATWPAAVAGCLLSSLSAATVLASGVQPHTRIDELEFRVGDLKAARFVNLERPHSRGSKANPERGQIIVLPADTPLEADHSYPMVFRADPRGHRIGRLDEAQNGILIPDWEIADGITTVVFRDSAPNRKDNPAFDLRIPVVAEMLQADNGTMAWVLSPVDPETKFADLKRKGVGPYIVLKDFHFSGTVAKAFSPDAALGEHLAMFEQRGADAPANPVLRQIVGDLGYRGPYFDDGQERAPSAIVAMEGFEPAVGSRVQLEFSTPERGIDFGVLRKGDVVVPAWDFLEDTRHAVLRHKTDPTLDQIVPVVWTREGGRLLFRSAHPEVVDFGRASNMKEFEGPYLKPPTFRFEAAVHSGVRLPDPPNTSMADRGQTNAVLAHRRSLVPIHPQMEAIGGQGESWTPHPAELALAGFVGPSLVHEGGALAFDAATAALGDAVSIPFAVLASVLALLGLLAWTIIAEGHARAIAPSSARAVATAIVLLGGLGAPWLAQDQFLRLLPWVLLPACVLAPFTWRMAARKA